MSNSSNPLPANVVDLGKVAAQAKQRAIAEEGKARPELAINSDPWFIERVNADFERFLIVLTQLNAPPDGSPMPPEANREIIRHAIATVVVRGMLVGSMIDPEAVRAAADLSPAEHLAATQTFVDLIAVIEKRALANGKASAALDYPPEKTSEK